MKKLTISVLALCWALSLPAQDRGAWTLARCVEYALEHNLQIQQSEMNVEQKEIALNTSQNSRLPGVSASGGQNFSFGRGLTADNTYANTNTTNTSFSVGADVPVFRGFQITHNIALSKLDLEAATLDLARAKDDIRVAVAQAYVQILYNMEILEVAKNQVSLDEAHVQRVAELLAAGKTSQVELSSQNAALAQSRLSVTQAENNLQMSLLDMTQLLELPSPEGFSVVRPAVEALNAAVLMDPDSIYEEAVGIKPSVKAEEVRLGHASRSIALAKSSHLPSLSLSGGLGTNYYTSSGFGSKPFMDQLQNNFSQYIGLNLSIPVFSRFSIRNQVRTAQLSYRNQELQLENVKKSLYKEIQQAYYNAVAAQEKYSSSEMAAESAKAAFELVEAKYENGKASITEYNDSKARFFSAESDLVQARYQYLYQSRLLDFYRGADIRF